MFHTDLNFDKNQSEPDSYGLVRTLNAQIPALRLYAGRILPEASSIEDDDFEFCVFCYNVQPCLDTDHFCTELLIQNPCRKFR